MGAPPITRIKKDAKREMKTLQRTIFWLMALTLPILGGMPDPAWAETKPPAKCQPVEEKGVKAEGYISRTFRKDRKDIYKEFAELGHTRVAIRPFFMSTTSKVFAVGRCVPAYLARHILKTALKYTSGVESLVTQAFLPTHWVGVATTIFDEPSQQLITAEQLGRLLDPSLNDAEFHALYREFSVQDELVPYFGLQRPNVKKVK